MNLVSRGKAWSVLCLLTLSLAAGGAGGVSAADPPEFKLTIRDHRFEPAVLEVPAGTMVKLVVHNQDATPEEFESHTLKREKIIAGNSTAIIYLGAMKPGTYEFVGEFHEDTAKGKIIAK